MKFMLMVHHKEAEVAKLAPQEIERVVQEHVSYTEALKAAGVLLVAPRGFRLKSGVEMVRVVKTNGAQVALDGPHAETKEVVGSFYLVDCASKAEALGWLKKHPMWDSDTLELREVWDC